MLFGFSSKEDLLSRARTQGNASPKPYKKAVELYYITRYFVSAFEARNHQIPLQVWNEYRNALDHFFRHVTLPDHPEYSEQLCLMENHIKRACLDVIKLTCHKGDEWLVNKIEGYDQQALLIVDNGEFIKSFQERCNKARDLFLEAKTQDHNFGASVSENKKIVSMYIDAAFAFESLREEIDNKEPVILDRVLELQKITGQAEGEARKKSFFPNQEIIKQIFVFIRII